MHKKVFYSTCFLAVVAMITIFSNPSFAQSQPLFQNSTSKTQVPASEPYEKQIILNLGYGPNGAGFAFGGRYWVFGATLGVTGFSSGIPAYVTDYVQVQSKPKVFELRTYTSTVVCGDLSYYYDIGDFSLFATLGYFSQLDTILEYSDKGYFAHTPYASKTVSGLTYGLGFQYVLESIAEDYFFFKPLAIGLGYQNKYGGYFQIAYRWY